MGKGDVGCEQSWWVRALGLARDSMLGGSCWAKRIPFVYANYKSFLISNSPVPSKISSVSLLLIRTAPQSFWKFCQILFSGLCVQIFPSSSRFPKYNSDVPVFWWCVIKYRTQSLLNPGQHSICLLLTSTIFLSLVPVPHLFGLAHNPTSLPPALTPQPLVLSPKSRGHLFCFNGSCALREGFFL